MKRRQEKETETARSIRMWTQTEADKAVPYVRSVVGSLREKWLEARNQRLQLERLDAKPGRPNRKTLVAREEALKDSDRALDAFNEAVEELQEIDVYPLDPVAGLALIPFQVGEDLAWFVFDLHDEGGLKSWRFHKDPLEERRPITDLANSPKLIV